MVFLQMFILFHSEKKQKELATAEPCAVEDRAALHSGMCCVVFMAEIIPLSF